MDFALVGIAILVVGAILYFANRKNENYAQFPSSNYDPLSYLKRYNPILCPDIAATSKVNVTGTLPGSNNMSSDKYWNTQRTAGTLDSANLADDASL